MMTRDRASLPQDGALYDSGFPRKPFSLLHWNSQLFGEEQAQIFPECVKAIWKTKPPIAILENVMGLLRKKVWKIVERYFNQLTDYLFCHLVIDPAKLGSPASRRRVYIILIIYYS